MKVILIHGFSKSARDMKFLKKQLQMLGYQCTAPNFPLTYQTFEDSVQILEKLVHEMEINEGEKIHLIGHSTGGLVIRKFLEETQDLEKIGRCILIGTPNKGSKLADFACKIKFLAKIYQTLHSISTDYVKKLSLREDYSVEIAAIAGLCEKRLVTIVIKEQNDGRVEVSSVYFSGLTDYIILQYHHARIHYKMETVQYVDHFLKYGSFGFSENHQANEWIRK